MPIYTIPCLRQVTWIMRTLTLRFVLSESLKSFTDSPNTAFRLKVFAQDSASEFLRRSVMRGSWYSTAEISSLLTSPGSNGSLTGYVCWSWQTLLVESKWITTTTDRAWGRFKWNQSEAKLKHVQRSRKVLKRSQSHGDMYFLLYIIISRVPIVVGVNQYIGLTSFHKPQHFPGSSACIVICTVYFTAVLLYLFNHPV